METDHLNPLIARHLRWSIYIGEEWSIWSACALNEEEKGILLKLIETFVSKKRFKDYLQKNIAAL